MLEGSSPSKWEDITNFTPLIIKDDCISFNTTVSGRYVAALSWYNFSQKLLSVWYYFALLSLLTYC